MRENPLVSFCIATHNRGATLVECLRRTMANGLPAQMFEILVVDNASTDGTADLVAKELPAVQVIRLKTNGGPVAKNVAMARARGEFLVLLDDDAYPHPGAVARMIGHFREDAHLAAAVFDVTLPDGTKEASAYPDVFIGAGTGLRRSALREVEGGGGGLPADFFMQAEEYDLSFRLIDAGYSVQRFWDMPLTHLKTPSARIGERATRLDVRNNLYLLAKYVPEPLCHELAAEWLARYWMMATGRDEMEEITYSPGFTRDVREETPRNGKNATIPGKPGAIWKHKRAYLAGAAEGLAKWTMQRDAGRHLLSAEALERIFKFEEIRHRLERVATRLGLRRIVLADFGKNILGYWRAAKSLGLEVVAVADERLGGEGDGREYRGVPLRRWDAAVVEAFVRGGTTGDAVIISNMSPVHGPRRAAELRRTLALPVVDLFSRQERLLWKFSQPLTLS